MDSQESQSPTAPLTLPNSVGHSLLTNANIVSFLSLQNSQSSSSEDLEFSEVSQDMPAPDESCSTNDSPDTLENDSIQDNPVKLMDDAHAEAGTNRTA